MRPREAADTPGRPESSDDPILRVSSWVEKAHLGDLNENSTIPFSFEK